MADPLPKSEIPKPQQIIIGETKLHLVEPLNIDGQEITSLTIQSADKRGIAGVGSSVLLTREPSRKKGNEGVIVDKPMMNLNDFDEVSWEKISGVQFRDESGAEQTIPKEKLSLEPPTVEAIPAQDQPVDGAAPELPAEPDMAPAEAPRVPSPAEVAALAETPLEAPQARAVLEGLKEDPNTITIVGLKAYEARAVDLAERSMQRLVTPRMQEREGATRTLWEKSKDKLSGLNDFFSNTLWKQSIGGIYFKEKARQYYMDMLQASETPFAEQSIRVAEARAQVDYDTMLADSNFLVRAGTKAVDWFRSNIGARTTVQKLALLEIQAMKEGEELRGLDIFEREAKAVRLRFSQDMEHADQFIRRSLGEDLEILDREKEEHKPLVEGIKKLLTDYANHDLEDKKAFDKASKEFFATTLKDAKPNIFAEAELYSSSLFDAAEVLRAKASHEGGMANVQADLAQMKIRLGIGQMGEATSLQMDKVPKAVEKVIKVISWFENKNIPLRPIFFNEAAIGSGVAIALSAANVFKTMPARIIGGLGAGAIAGGAFAGFREYHRLQDEYLTHVREREVGTTFGEHLQKRKWFEKYVVKQRSADDLMGSLQSTLYTPEGVFKDSLTADELRMSFATLADVQARKTLSETPLNRGGTDIESKRIGLIQFTGRENIESQRTALEVVSNKALTDLATYAQAHEVEVAKVLGGNTFPDFMVKLTIDQTRILKEGVNIIGSLEDPVKNVLGIVSSYAPEAEMIRRRFVLGSQLPTEGEKALGIDAIFAEFKKEARVEAIKYGIKQGVIGAGVGAALHEAFVLLNGGIHSDILDRTTDTVKDTIKNTTNESVFAPDIKDAAHETMTLSAPTPANIWHNPLGDYQIPQELEITPSITDPHSAVIDHFDAVLHESGPLGRDISLGDHLSTQQLMDKLRSIDGIEITDPTDAGIISTKGIEIPDLVTKYGDQIHAQLPEGYHFDHLTPTGRPDSWQLLDANNNVVATGLDFKADGSLANVANVQNQLLEHNLKLETSGSLTITHPGAVVGPDGLPVPAGSTIEKIAETVPSAPSSETITLRGADMGDGGLWEYFLKKTDGENSMATTNGMKNLFRLYTHSQDNANINIPDGSIDLRSATFGDQSVQEFDIARIPSNATITLPESVFGQHGIDTFQDIQKQALLDYQRTLATAGVIGPGDAIQHMYDAGGQQKIEAIVLKLGYAGQDSQLPNASDINLLMEKMGAVTETVPASTPTVPVVEVPVDPVVLHPINIYAEPAPAAPGAIFAEKPIEVPYILPSQAEDLAGVAGTAQGAVEGLGGTQAQGAATESLFDTLPWIPVFIPTRRGLESARSPIPETVGPIDISSSMLSPFGLETDLITREQLTQRASPRLVENPQVALDSQQEIRWYLDTLKPEEVNLNAELVAQEPRPMSPTTRAAIIIPASNNSASISQALTHYIAQKDKDGNALNPASYELVVYNALIGEGAADELKTMVDQFKADHPDTQLVYVTHAYADVPTQGQLKRDASNFVLQRVADRIPQPAQAPTEATPATDGEPVASTLETPPVAESAPLPDVSLINDPGLMNELPPTYVSSMMEGLSADREMMVGQFVYPKEAYEQLPMIFAPYRTYELVDALTRHTHADGLPNTVSGNSAVRTSTLAAVGGYNPGSKHAEDRELAWMIQQSRGNADTIGTNPDTLTFEPKNILYAQLQRAGVADATGDLATNEAYKAMSWQDMGEKVKSVYTRDMLQDDLTGMYNGLYPALHAKDPESFDRNFHFALDSIGLAHEIADGKVTILDESKLASAITGIPDIESFSKVTAEKFAEQDRTAREILANMAGTPEQSVPQEPVEATEQLGSNLSSPELDLDVVKDVSPTETLTPPQETVSKPVTQEQLPAGINDRIDYVLEKNHNEKSASVTLTPGELMHYLKTDLDIAGTRVVGGDITYNNGKLHLDKLTAKALGGSYEFSGDLMSDPQKGLVVDPNTLEMKLPLLFRWWTKTAREQALQLSQLMLKHVDERSNPMWKASRIDLVGEKLEIKFNKKI